jgi:hypothetical protein
MFHLYLFKAGFSMNKFVVDLKSNDHFYLKSLIDELSMNSDLVMYRDLIVNYVTIKSENDLLIMEYQPELPISIFFEKNIIAIYNSIFNFIIRIKKNCNIIKNNQIEKKLKSMEIRYYLTEAIEMKKILKYLIALKIRILNFINNLEFHIFVYVIYFNTDY